MRSGKFVLVGVMAAGLVGGYQTVGAQTAAARPATPRPAAAKAAAAPVATAAEVEGHQQYLKQYCITCHNERNKKAVRGFSLEKEDLATVAQHPDVWEKVIKKLRAGQMPPLTAKRPERAMSDGVASYLENVLDRQAKVTPNPGRTETLHRLNRTEYGNVVRDLFGLEMRFDDLLPADPLGGGDASFDNIATSLRLDQGLLEQYLSVAKRVARTAVGGDVPKTTETFKLNLALPQDEHFEGLPFGSRGGLGVNFPFPLDATYVITAYVIGNGEELLEVSVDGERVGSFEIKSEVTARGLGAGKAKQLEVTIPVKAGQRKVVATFVKGKARLEWEADRLPYTTGQTSSGGAAAPLPRLEQLTVVGPINPTGKGQTDSRKKVFTCRPTSKVDEEPCARSIITTIVRRGYRRPVTDADVNVFMNFFKEGRAESDFDAGVEKAIRALLVSPEFLYRIEAQPAGVAPGAPYRISDLELASRLSFFIWSSVPDDQLINLASTGQLKNPLVLDKQVRRMLADPRAAALTKSFGSLYLWVRNVGAQTPASQVYPNFDEILRNAMSREMEMFFDSIRGEDRSVLELLDAKYTFVNERLAKHYGITGVKGAEFRRVALADDSPRRGILGKGSLLLVTSVPQRTSPVKRGKWVLDNVLGAPPPPPPANVPPLADAKTNDGRILTIRELMAKHRANPVCAACHSVIDPVGFALEQFDATGKWRDVDASFTKIEPTGTMPDGSKFSTLTEFRSLITQRPDPFLRTFTDKLLMYALGRGSEPFDAPTVRTVVAGAKANNYKFSSLVLGIVKSTPFQMRRAVEAPKPSGLSASR